MKISKRALILGVSGQDGSLLAHFLLDKGYEVYGTSRDVYTANFQNLEVLGVRQKIKLVSVTLSDFRSILQCVLNVEPDEIYNLASQSSVGRSFEEPVETFESISLGTLNLLEVLRMSNHQIKFYNACSSECFGNTNGRVATEDTPFSPRSPYAVAKASAFWQVANYREAYNLFACSGILFNHESPFRHKRFVTKKIIEAVCRIAQGSSERLSLGNIEVQRDWGWAQEFIEAMWLMLQQEFPEDYVIGTGVTTPLRCFVETAFSILGLDWNDHVDLKSDLLRPTDILISASNPSKAKEKLGWSAKVQMYDVARLMIESELEIH